VAIGLENVKERIARASVRSGRKPDAVSLVAVSKQQSDAAVMDTYRAGQRMFGENRQQGLQSRLAGDLPVDIEWHFIGPLQSRKVAYVAANAALVHSFDRAKLGTKWPADGAPALLQFNMAREPQKSGFDPSDWELAAEGAASSGVHVVGVMAIPPLVDDPNDSRGWFRELRRIFDRLASQSYDITTCSMGMSHDFEVAIEEGATMVRVGTAIFGHHQ
jgi:hypothetical protein